MKNLRAAAPELLGALEGMIEASTILAKAVDPRYLSDANAQKIQGLAEKAHAAISRAKGEGDNELGGISVVPATREPAGIEQSISNKLNKGVLEIFPNHYFVSNWVFQEHEEHEAALAHEMAAVAEKSGMNQNDLQHIFPAVLRMLKSKCAWAGNDNK